MHGQGREGVERVCVKEDEGADVVWLGSQRLVAMIPCLHRADQAFSVRSAPGVECLLREIQQLKGELRRARQGPGGPGGGEGGVDVGMWEEEVRRLNA
eukprot:3300152-Rhodomonas_salina.1